MFPQGIKISNKVFFSILASFILAMSFVTQARGGRDLKVGLFGVDQTAHKRSPYENPTDANRTIFRYAPGITILQYPFMLKSEHVKPFVFNNIFLSIAAWYAFEIALLLLSLFFLWKLLPSASPQESFNKLKLSFLMAVPFIGYEISNSQNKIAALFFVLFALYCFERKKMFWSALLLNIAATIYVPLFVFIIYFTLRSRGRYILPFIAAALVIFGVIPTFVFGFSFNIFLLKEWYTLSLQPFMATNTYASYIDLRESSQSLPSAVGRMFVTGHTGSFKYSLSPEILHLIIKVSSAVIVIFSTLALLKRPTPASRGLEYTIFFILAMLLPQYCIYYTWAWLFVFYYAVFTYAGYPGVPQRRKQLLLICAYAMFFSSLFIGFDPANRASNFFWSTLILWAGIIGVLLQERREETSAAAK